MNIVIENLLVSYFEDGAPTSPTILLLHGWGSSSQSFTALASYLSTTFRVIRLDLPGFGGSEIPPDDWSIQDYVRITQAAMSKLGISNLEAIIGHSFGGRIAIKAMGLGSLHSSKLILMGSAGIKHSDTLRNQAFKTVAKLGKFATNLPGLSKLRSHLRHSLYQAAGSTDYLTAGPMRKILQATIAEDLRSDAAKVKIPTLLIWGEDDRETPLADGRLLEHIIPQAELEVISHAGHYVYLDAPQTVNAHIRKFLK